MSIVIGCCIFGCTFLSKMKPEAKMPNTGGNLMNKLNEYCLSVGVSPSEVFGIAGLYG